jgi:hypothetical protein
MEAAAIFKCRLSRVPGAMLSGWRVCRRLALYENALTRLPPEIGDMEALQELWLYDNRLEELPPEIGRLQQLQRLWLDRNLLECLPREIGRCGKLQVRGGRRPAGRVGASHLPNGRVA